MANDSFDLGKSGSGVPAKKLALRRESLVELTDVELAQVEGGTKIGLFTLVGCTAACWITTFCPTTIGHTTICYY
jgi:hypothetical protein